MYVSWFYREFTVWSVQLAVFVDRKQTAQCKPELMPASDYTWRIGQIMISSRDQSLVARIPAVLMKDIKTEGVYLSRRTVNLLGLDFALSGYAVHRLHNEAGIMNAYLDTLSNEARQKLRVEMDRRSVPASDKTMPGR